MAFEKVETSVDFPAEERTILALWDELQAFEKLRAKNKGKPKWSFLDGPITANNPMGVHHAWGRTYADWAKPPGERKSYFTMAEENNYTIWSFLKKCHERKLVYKSYDAMPWCGRCGTGISQQEMNEGYHMVAHRSVFVKFPLLSTTTPFNERGEGERIGEYLLIWTTTPW